MLKKKYLKWHQPKNEGKQEGCAVDRSVISLPQYEPEAHFG
jgi:hypothetical protein